MGREAYMHTTNKVLGIVARCKVKICIKCRDIITTSHDVKVHEELNHNECLLCPEVTIDRKFNTS